MVKAASTKAASTLSDSPSRSPPPSGSACRPACARADASTSHRAHHHPPPPLPGRRQARHPRGRQALRRAFNYDLAACANYELALNELVQQYGEIRARFTEARVLRRTRPQKPLDVNAEQASPPPSPPDSSDEDDEEEHRPPETTPANRAPPSPPPSPPQPLSTRLSLSRAAEEAVTATYAYPRYPGGFTRDVQPHICRYIQAEGRKTYKATTYAVYAVLILGNPRTEAASEAVVARTLHGSPRAMRDWKKIIDYRRAEAVDAATPLTMAPSPRPRRPRHPRRRTPAKPRASSPPSPPCRRASATPARPPPARRTKTPWTPSGASAT